MVGLKGTPQKQGLRHIVFVFSDRYKTLFYKKLVGVLGTYGGIVRNIRWDYEEHTVGLLGTPTPPKPFIYGTFREWQKSKTY